MSGGEGEESGFLLPAGPEAELGPRDWNRDEGGVGRARTKLVVPPAGCGRRLRTEA